METVSGRAGLYAFGESEGDVELPLMDISYKMPLAEPIRFYGTDYHNLYVCGSRMASLSGGG